MDESRLIKDLLRDEFEQFNLYLKESIKHDNTRIMRIVEHVFKTDGKFVRPMLVFLTAKSCGEITAATYHGAVTVELLHTASLIHDDVVDESKQRRHQPSVNAVFDNQRAVLGGDYFLSTALKESVKTKNLDVVNIIAELGRNLALGELNQYSIANEIIIDEEEYFKVIDNKTASLMSACTKIGAITAGASEEVVNNFGKLGQLLGICFQLRDDIFDYYQSDIGKPTGNDIREGKVTLPMIYALQNAPKNLSNEMFSIIKNFDFSVDNIAKLIDFSKNNGGIEYAYQKMEVLLSEADYMIEHSPLSEEIKPYLRLLLKYLKNRAY